MCILHNLLSENEHRNVLVASKGGRMDENNVRNRWKRVWRCLQGKQESERYNG